MWVKSDPTLKIFFLFSLFSKAEKIFVAFKSDHRFVLSHERGNFGWENDPSSFDSLKRAFPKVKKILKKEICFKR